MSTAIKTLQRSGDMAVDMVSIPASLLQKMSEATKSFTALEDEWEDYLLAQDADLVARMRQTRAHHLAGQTRPLDALKQELCIK